MLIGKHAALAEARITRVWSQILHQLVTRLPPHIVFLLVGGVNALVLTLITPPFQIHDEFQHFFRSYQLSEFTVWGNVQDGRPGGDIPSSLLQFVERAWGTLEIWTIPPVGEHPLAQIWRELQFPLLPNRRQFAEFLTVDYSPLLYLPQTFGIAVGRLFGGSPLALLILGRLANAATAVASIAWALRIMPIGRTPALAAALLPMAQYEYGSVAPDAMIIAAAFLLTAIMLRAGSTNAWRSLDFLVSVVAAGLICAKVVYAPLLAAGVPALRTAGASPTSWNPKVRRLSVRLALAAIALALTVVWLESTGAMSVSLVVPAATIAARKAAIVAEPLRFAQMLATDIQSNGFFYAIDTIGILGAWRVFLPTAVYIFAALSLALSCILVDDDDPRLPQPVIAWNLCMIAAVVILIQTALFIFSPDHPEFWQISGIQGRYFLPLGAVTAATVASIKWIPRLRHAQAFGYLLLIAIIVFDTVSVDATIVDQFHLI